MNKRAHALSGILFVGWTLLILLAYLSGFPSLQHATNSVLDEIVLGVALLLVSVLTGNRFLRLFVPESPNALEELLFSAGIGLGLLSTSVFVLGLFQILRPESFLVLCVGFCALAASNYRYGKTLLTKIKDYQLEEKGSD